MDEKEKVLKHYQELPTIYCKQRRICHVLKELYDRAQDEETRELIIEATAMAMRMQGRLIEYKRII